MEKRKLLLVAVSVGVFLVIVLSAAILIFTPGAGGAMAARPVQQGGVPPVPAIDPRGPASADAADMVRNTGDLQDLLVLPPGAASSVSGANPAGGSGSPVSASAVQENNFYINGQTAAQSSSQPSTQASATEQGDPSRVVIIPKPSAPGVPAPAPRTETRPASSGQAPARQNPANPASPVRQGASGSSGSSSSSGAASSGTASSSTASSGTASSGAASGTTVQARPANPPAGRAPASPAPSSASTTRTVAARSAARTQRDYWIQTGAFSALIRAEDAKETLASKGLTSIIDDGEVDGQTWYRVRVGPYTSENEASYWLALVRAINGFDQSQIRSTQR